jgi:putative FmdB family regulatory protein
VPIYTYRCDRCDREFEVRQSYKDKPAAPCPECGEEARRTFCPVPIVFKGPGFYTTDSRGVSAASSKDGD